jgi:hypothetical protein
MPWIVLDFALLRARTSGKDRNYGDDDQELDVSKVNGGLGKLHFLLVSSVPFLVDFIMTPSKRTVP